MIRHSVVLFLQGLIEASEKAKSELGKELDHIKGENENLKGNLQLQLKESDQLKVTVCFEQNPQILIRHLKSK